MLNRALLAVAVSTALLSTAALAQVERQYGAHVHGVASGNLAIDGADLRLELEIPGFNLVGFEHAPRSEEQQAALDNALAFLRAADWVQADPRGGCEVASINAHTHGFSDAQSHDHAHDHGHDHHHDHAHGHGSEHDDHDHAHAHDHDHGHGHAAEHGAGHDHHQEAGHDHSEFHIVLTMECENPGRLGWIDLRLFEDFSGNERMDIDVLTETLATQLRLTPGSERISLR